MQKGHTYRQAGNTILIAVLFIVIIALLGVAGYFAYKYYTAPVASVQPQAQNTQQTQNQNQQPTINQTDTVQQNNNDQNTDSSPDIQKVISVKSFLNNCDGPAGGYCTVKWTSSGLNSSDKISIFLINKSGGFSYLLNKNSDIILGAKSYSWTMPEEASRLTDKTEYSNYPNKAKYQIKICDLTADSSICGESDYFTIHIND